MILVSLFLVAFISATIWPLASEAVFVAYLMQEGNDWRLLLAVATFGNSLGSLLMYELALLAHQSLLKRMDRMSVRLALWQQRVQRFGPIVLFLAWLPVVGDVLPIAAGLLKLPRYSVYFWVTFGKFARYAFVSWVTLLNY